MGDRAVVLGSGIAGLLAARVLSDFFTDVTLIERDSKPIAPIPRKGVPQGHHIHVLLNKGEEIIETLLPGFKEALFKGGSVQATLGKEVKWYLAGKWMPTFEGGMVTFFQSRPLLEQVLRDLVLKIRNVNIHYDTVFKDYVYDLQGDRVTAVTVHEKGVEESVSLPADFILDASGRGSSLVSQLEKMEKEVPRESRVGVDFAYSSGLFELTAPLPDACKAILVYPKAPKETRAAAIVPVEGNKWLVTAAGYNGDHPPLDKNGFLEFTKSLSQPEIHDALQSATLVDELKPFKFKAGIRRYFHKSDPLPKNLLAIGDVICSANPFFGQGIAVAAQEVKVLQDCLKENGVAGLCRDSFSRQDYFERISKILDISWGLAIGEDLKYPTTTGERPFGFTLSRWFKDRIMSSDNPAVARQFYKVMHFAAPPRSLVNYQVLKSVFTSRS
ncbi:NAD(P)/FAD-dependent oxidoreductase [Sneathiella sp.]|jgi:2-polyprenyl-6-methoxyphenol hydroxylase-like FAD-dependent oxidoreductase|uniref:NAD(P)/FAD-dependent oxidoreductase n=1 Tax=Sneathiella sp. TaxID=1964365 RepID=UPI0039E6A4A8